MRRRWVLPFVILLSTFLVHVPPVHAQSLEVGIRNGVVRSTVQGEVLHPSLRLNGGRVQKSVQTGLQVSGVLALPLSDRLGLQVELQYAQKGVALRGEWTQTCGGPTVLCVVPSLDGTYQLTYLQLPALLSWEFRLGTATAIRALVGPSFDLLLDAQINTASLRPSALPEHAFSPKSNAQLGAVGGVEVRYNLSSAGALLLSARYHPEVTEIAVIGSDASFRSRAYVFGVGYAVQL
jgi:hypothetical protein